MTTTDSLSEQRIRYKFYYAITGLILGLLCIIGGIALFFYGVSGSSDWHINIFGVESKLTQAAPGVVLFVVGLLVVIFTRFKYKSKISTRKTTTTSQSTPGNEPAAGLAGATELPKVRREEVVVIEEIEEIEEEEEEEEEE